METANTPKKPPKSGRSQYLKAPTGTREDWTRLAGRIAPFDGKTALNLQTVAATDGLLNRYVAKYVATACFRLLAAIDEEDPDKHFIGCVARRAWKCWCRFRKLELYGEWPELTLGTKKPGGSSGARIFRGLP